MMRNAAALRTPETVIARLGALVPLDHAAVTALRAAVAQSRIVAPRRELMAEGRPTPPPQLIVNGWAARVRMLVDGRRQFMSFLLPGDLIGHCRQPQPIAVSTVIALTELAVCPAPDAQASRVLDEAYAISTALEEAYLLAHIARLGRMNAEERIADLLLELYERLDRAGLVTRGRYTFPLTQEMLGDALGLTSVHVNRMVQQARRAADLSWKGGQVTLDDPQSLARRIGHVPVRVTAVGD